MTSREEGRRVAVVMTASPWTVVEEFGCRTELNAPTAPRLFVALRRRGRLGEHPAPSKRRDETSSIEEVVARPS